MWWVIGITSGLSLRRVAFESCVKPKVNDDYKVDHFCAFEDHAHLMGGLGLRRRSCRMMAVF